MPLTEALCHPNAQPSHDGTSRAVRMTGARRPRFLIAASPNIGSGAATSHLGPNKSNVANHQQLPVVRNNNVKARNVQKYDQASCVDRQPQFVVIWREGGPGTKGCARLAKTVPAGGIYVNQSASDHSSDAPTSTEPSCPTRLEFCGGFAGSNHRRRVSSFSTRKREFRCPQGFTS
jgi:hypothetical protein